MSRIRRCAGRAILTAGCALGAISFGCQSAQVTQSVTAKSSGDDMDSQLNFWHELANRRLASNDDAFHGVLLDLDGHDKCADYAQRVAALKSRGMLKASFDEPANSAVRRGTLATIIVKILGIRGGWAMHVFGSTERYDLRELVYEGVFPPSSPQQTFSGAEFVGVIGRVDDFENPVAANNSSP